MTGGFFYSELFQVIEFPHCPRTARRGRRALQIPGKRNPPPPLRGPPPFSKGGLGGSLSPQNITISSLPEDSPSGGGNMPPAGHAPLAPGRGTQPTTPKDPGSQMSARPPGHPDGFQFPPIRAGCTASAAAAVPFFRWPCQYTVDKGGPGVHISVPAPLLDRE